MTGYLLDTNVLSEVIAPQPSPAVLTFLDALPQDQLYLSAITIAELWQGIVRLPESKRRRQLTDWMRAAVLPTYGSHILPVDIETAFVWGDLTARLFIKGMAVSFSDALIAATAKQHGLTMITRNVSHFERTAVTLLNPWTDPPPITRT